MYWQYKEYQQYEQFDQYEQSLQSPQSLQSVQSPQSPQFLQSTVFTFSTVFTSFTCASSGRFSSIFYFLPICWMLYAVFDWSWYWVKWERQMCLTRSMYSLAGGPSGLLTSCPSAAQAMWPMVSDHWSQRYWRWITSSSDGLQRSNWIIICNSWSTWWRPLKVNTVKIIFHQNFSPVHFLQGTTIYSDSVVSVVE